ncbi:hypothetical protein BAUCODRAFT_150663 [Baudoinia panamericana UAMH 10762]|uniref:Uncharacterized protein n=1 Tax=Baudoinia panamericana (strain UAMH 10762) TaxID=717646 RepID=M2N2V8_BAUPA|nr:uncharacterized protein BAUCODRAFT_150663 [Baudoinia panamericana UAMH 10762]EMC93314.1 hypothetical protein BAUCODRAFT_150663 [Baudoinia panamericana UAMH 10762]
MSARQLAIEFSALRPMPCTGVGVLEHLPRITKEAVLDFDMLGAASDLNRYWHFASPQYANGMKQFTTFTYKLQQCIVHDLSKLIINEELPGIRVSDPAIRLREALRLRKQLNLPDIPITMRNPSLLEIVESRVSTDLPSVEGSEDAGGSWPDDGSIPYLLLSPLLYSSLR